ncbi:hypothetical protein Agabi119p4_2758 [Agaricus bisporus var. burnettii]|uniref:Alkyl transferase n=1 Tax=Agaricus bisporus var. burnettii TaxID=192524 RepID=A0A8H7F5Y2_AGABI|nr:hypothetical protein Agabi119p4_2758 [Agaricus bisporus var. burnettii]
MVLRRGLRWIYNKIVTNTQRCIISILTAGPVPRHVAFVMDGNRRYARIHGKEVQQGHMEGFVALRRVLDICLRMNVHCVSAYAFAIDNFNRPKEEVDALMNLAQSKLLELCNEGDLLDEYGVRLNIVGRIELFPKALQEAIRKAENMTRQNNKAILNLHMAYASTDEMTTAIEDCVKFGLTHNIDLDTYFTQEEIDKHLMTTAKGSPPLDVLIRTSGVKRLSNYLVWQCCQNTQIQFSSIYWPDFGFWDFIPIILDYQRKIWSRRISA